MTFRLKPKRREKTGLTMGENLEGLWNIRIFEDRPNGNNLGLLIEFEGLTALVFKLGVRFAQPILFFTNQPLLPTILS